LSTFPIEMGIYKMGHGSSLGISMRRNAGVTAGHTPRFRGEERSPIPIIAAGADIGNGGRTFA
jgi:hypothetical protein